MAFVLKGNNEAEVLGSDANFVLDASSCNAVSQAVTFNSLNFLKSMALSPTE